MKSFVFGSLVATIVCLSLFQYLTENDMDIMTKQNELLNGQQELLSDIQANCTNRNWIAFGDEVFVCMPVNQMFHQLSHPPAPHFREQDENQA